MENASGIMHALNPLFYHGFKAFTRLAGENVEAFAVYRRMKSELLETLEVEK